MGSVSPMVIVGASLIGLGEILHMVGVATHHWAGKEKKVIESSLGLWKFCSGGTCKDIDELGDTWDEISSDMEAVRALVLIGLLCGVVGIVVAGIMIVFSVLRKAVPSTMPILCLGSTIGAFIFIIIGTIVFRAKPYEDTLKDIADLAYSFVLCIVGPIMMPIGGGLVFMGTSGSDRVAQGP